MEPGALGAYLERSAEAAKQAAGRTARTAGTHFRMDGSTAVVGILGTILPDVSVIDEVVAEIFGDQSTSSRATTDLINSLAADPKVDAIMLAIDSPGGHSTGLSDLGDAIAEAAKTKPVHAHAPDLANSAALWVASQASRFTLGKTADAGSIGAYTVVNDVSKAFEQAGIKTHVISTGGVKGAGVFGTELTTAQRKDIQRNIDSLGAHFVEAVAEGRGMAIEDVRKLATGQTWIGQEAVDLGLADAVATESEALAALNQSKKPAKPAPKRPAIRAAAKTKKEPRMNLAEIYSKLAKGETLTEAEIDFLREKTGEPETPIEARTDVPDDIRAQFAAEKAEREKLAQEIAELRAAGAREAYLAEADSFKYVPALSREDIADELAAADKRGSESGKRIRKHFAATHEAIRQGGLMREIGSARSGDLSAQQQLEQKADDIRKADPSLSKEQAFMRACRENRDLYARVEGLMARKES